MNTTCYVVAILNTQTMKIDDFHTYSESARTLTRVGDDGHHYLDVFDISGCDYEEACINAVRFILRDDFMDWLHPWARKEKKRLEVQTQRAILV